LDIGIATEISVSEAFRFLVTTRQYVLFTVVFSVFLLIGMSVVFMLGQKRIAQSEENLRTVIDSAPDGFIMIDVSGTVERFNQSAENIFGYSSREIIGKNIKILMPEPYHAQHDGYLTRFLTTGDKKIIGKGREVEGRRKDGSVFPLDLIVAEARAGTTRKFVGITRDITDRKRIERMKTEFISTVSHELRTPLTSIKGSLGLIAGGAVGEIKPKAQSMVSLALKNTERLISLVNDILDMEKIESGKMEFSFNPLNIFELVQQAIENDRAYADELGVSVVMNQIIKNAFVTADAERLSQVLANLLSNAAKFSHKGGQVEISIERKKNVIRVSVSDTGIGISPDFKEKIFQRFSQADATDSRKTGGTGLGLNISKAIIERHGGTIGFESTVGHGSTFYFEIQEINKTNFVRTESEIDGAGKLISAKGHFLVCEDDPDIASLISMILNNEGYEVDIALNAKEATSKLAEKNYDAMTVDIILPDMDGLSLIRKIRARKETRELPIIIVSIKSQEEGLNSLSAVPGIINWIEKPIDKNQLLRSVKSAMQASNNKRHRILYVEDDYDLTKVISELIPDTAQLDITLTLKDARKYLAEFSYDLVIIDVVLPDGSGLDLLQEISEKPEVRSIIFAAAEVDQTVRKKVDAVFIKSKTPNQVLVEKIVELLSSPERNNPKMEIVP
jgi:PAS domain S-box-containing protein